MPGDWMRVCVVGRELNWTLHDCRCNRAINYVRFHPQGWKEKIRSFMEPFDAVLPARKWFYDWFSSKCIPILMHGLEACFLTVSDIRSLDFAVIRFLMKLFQTVNMLIIQDCLEYFNFNLPSVLLVERQKTFSFNYANCDNSTCNIFHDWYLLAHLMSACSICMLFVMYTQTFLVCYFILLYFSDLPIFFGE